MLCTVAIQNGLCAWSKCPMTFWPKGKSQEEVNMVVWCWPRLLWMQQLQILRKTVNVVHHWRHLLCFQFTWSKETENKADFLLGWCLQAVTGRNRRQMFYVCMCECDQAKVPYVFLDGRFYGFFIEPGVPFFSLPMCSHGLLSFSCLCEMVAKLYQQGHSSFVLFNGYC